MKTAPNENTRGRAISLRRHAGGERRQIQKYFGSADEGD
jgi:hypothetical protein